MLLISLIFEKNFISSINQVTVHSTVNFFKIFQSIFKYFLICDLIFHHIIKIINHLMFEVNSMNHLIFFILKDFILVFFLYMKQLLL